MGASSCIKGLGCLAVDIHNVNFLSSPCLHIRRGEIPWKIGFLFRNVKRATGKSTALSTPKTRDYTWVVGTVLNQSVYVCFPFPAQCWNQAGMAVLEREHSQRAPWGGVDALLFSPNSVPTQIPPQTGSTSNDIISDRYTGNPHFYLTQKDHTAPLSMIHLGNDERWAKLKVCNYIGPIKIFS